MLSRCAIVAGVLACATVAHAVPDKSSDLAEYEKQLTQAEQTYLAQLESYLPGAYLDRFAKLSDADLIHIAQTRRLWQFYTLTRSPMYDFQREFLDPIDRVGQMLLIDPARIRDRKIAQSRRDALRIAQRLDAARKKADINLDATHGKKSPTGIAYPSLDEPHTEVQRLELMERSLVLACTVASPEAKNVLMNNAERCAQLDVQEAAFVMYGNKVRMLTGTIAWIADPLSAACGRDHSIDRKAGKASGHSSTIPGKEGFTDRLRRMGAKGAAEGAGGGRTGIEAIRGFSYGGGHTGPLYSLKRNVVGPGQRQGAYTSIYYTDDSMRHPCHATAGELFLPPGITRKHLTTQPVKTAYNAFKKNRFNQAHESLTSQRPGGGIDGAIHRYLLARVKAEVGWTLEGIERIALVGDVYEAQVRLEAASPQMRGIAAFDRAARKFEAGFAKKKMAAEIDAGRQYRKVCALGYTVANLEKFIERYPDSVYADAARRTIELFGGKQRGYTPLMYFREKDAHINKWAYLIDVRGR